MAKYLRHEMLEHVTVRTYVRTNSTGRSVSLRVGHDLAVHLAQFCCLHAALTRINLDGC